MEEIQTLFLNLVFLKFPGEKFKKLINSVCTLYILVFYLLAGLCQMFSVLSQ